MSGVEEALLWVWSRTRGQGDKRCSHDCTDDGRYCYYYLLMKRTIPMDTIQTGSQIAGNSRLSPFLFLRDTPLTDNLGPNTHANDTMHTLFGH